MKTIFATCALLTSLTAFSAGSFVEGTYENGKKECNLELSYDGNNVRVLTEVTKITPYGVWPFLPESMANEQYDLYDGEVRFDTGTGMTRARVVYVDVKFNENKEVQAFTLTENTSSDLVICENMTLKK